MQNTKTISAAYWGWRDIFRFFRRQLQSIGALITIALLFSFRGDIAHSFATSAWNLEAFYGALFNWSSILGALLFGVYAFVVSRSEPFVRSIEQTAAFQSAKDYIRHSVYLLLAMTALVMPMLVAPVRMTDGAFGDLGFWIFSAYAVASVYLFGRFFKVVRVFRLLERKRD